MSFSSIGAKQREKEEKALRYFLAFSLIGSVVLHVVVLTLSSLWVRTPEIAEEPIGVMVIDKPSLQAAKPKGGVVAIGGGRRSGKKSQGGSVAAGVASIRGASREGRTAVTSSKLPSQPKAAATASARRNAITSIAQSKPKPVETTTTREPFDSLKPKPAQTRSPVATLKPKRATTLPPKPASSPKPVIIPSPSPTATLQTKPTQPTQVPPLQFPQHAKISAPTQPLLARQQVQSDHSREVSDAPQGHAAASGNRDSSSTRDSGNRDSGQTVGSSNRPGNGSATDPGNGSGNPRAVATGSRSDNGNGFTTGSGSGTVACRSCPIPEYPPGAEDLEGRAVVVIEVDRDGNVNDVQIAESTGHDILDRAVLETVKKKWKFASSENEQRVRAAVNFATQGSDFYRQARERERQARKLEQQRKR